jgi:hypothetical protein
MTATSPSGTPLIISILSLVVAILAVFVARSNVQRQIQVTAREAWIREFREQVATLLANGANADRTCVSCSGSVIPNAQLIEQPLALLWRGRLSGGRWWRRRRAWRRLLLLRMLVKLPLLIDVRWRATVIVVIAATVAEEV